MNTIIKYPQGENSSKTSVDYARFAQMIWRMVRSFVLNFAHDFPKLSAAIIIGLLGTVGLGFSLLRPDREEIKNEIIVDLVRAEIIRSHSMEKKGDTLQLVSQGVEEAKEEIEEVIPQPIDLDKFPEPTHEAAPSVKNKTTDKIDPQEYILKYAPLARSEMAKYGVPASITLAQGMCESRSGNSKLALENNNHFGVKCFSKNCKKGHCTNFTDDTHKDFFRKYKTVWESFRAHSVHISSGRYAKLKKYGRDYRQWAYGLKSVGYATDRTYAEKLIGIIERYDLHRFDK